MECEALKHDMALHPAGLVVFLLLSQVDPSTSAGITQKLDQAVHHCIQNSAIWKALGAQKTSGDCLQRRHCWAASGAAPSLKLRKAQLTLMVAGRSAADQRLPLHDGPKLTKTALHYMIITRSLHAIVIHGRYNSK